MTEFLWQLVEWLVEGLGIVVIATIWWQQRRSRQDLSLADVSVRMGS